MPSKAEKEEILYPIFLECCAYAQEPFWEDIFLELSHGKTPLGCYMIKSNFPVICCNKKGSEFTYKITNQDAKTIFDELYEIFVNKLNILSSKQKSKRKQEFEDFQKMLFKNQNWSSIRKKNTKDSLYEKYVIDKKKEYNLTIPQCKKLLGLILIAIMFKTITINDIVYENDKIEEIKGIEFRKNVKGNVNIHLTRPLCQEKEVILDFEENNTSLKKISEKYIKYKNKDYIA